MSKLTDLLRKATKRVTFGSETNISLITKYSLWILPFKEQPRYTN